MKTYFKSKAAITSPIDDPVTIWARDAGDDNNYCVAILETDSVADALLSVMTAKVGSFAYGTSYEAAFLTAVPEPLAGLAARLEDITSGKYTKRYVEREVESVATALRRWNLLAGAKKDLEEDEDCGATPATEKVAIVEDEDVEYDEADRPRPTVRRAPSEDIIEDTEEDDEAPTKPRPGVLESIRQGTILLSRVAMRSYVRGIRGAVAKTMPTVEGMEWSIVTPDVYVFGHKLLGLVREPVGKVVCEQGQQQRWRWSVSVPGSSEKQYGSFDTLDLAIAEVERVLDI